MNEICFVSFNNMLYKSMNLSYTNKVAALEMKLLLIKSWGHSTQVSAQVTVILKKPTTTYQLLNQVLVD